MQSCSLREFAYIVGGNMQPQCAEAQINAIYTDSRHVTAGSMFVALQGTHRDGHEFVANAFQNGASAALVADSTPIVLPPDTTAPLIRVADPLSALCLFAAHCRQQFPGSVLAVTGSNGKTTVKDALLHILAAQGQASASPGSFNSRLGVALSLSRLPSNEGLHIQEAGISEPGDMARLEPMIRPDFGILTNIGWAHIATMGSREQIAREKMLLFQRLTSEGWLLMPASDPLLEQAASALPCRIYRYGTDTAHLPVCVEYSAAPEGSLLRIRFPDDMLYSIPVAARSQEDAADLFIAACAAHLLNVPQEAIAAALRDYAPRLTRREFWKTPNGVTVISDAYDAEPLSTQSALNALHEAGSSGRRFFVFGGQETTTGKAQREPQTPGKEPRAAYRQIGHFAARAGVTHLALVGGVSLSTLLRAFEQDAPHADARQFPDMAAARTHLLANLRDGDALLVKAADSASMDRLALTLMEAMAPNRFYVNVQAIEENVARFRRLAGPGVRLLAMVKALAYGSDATRLALELQDVGVDWMGVSTPDEGSALRRAGVRLPILVMLCAPDEAEKLLHSNLTPVLYSEEIALAIAHAARQQGRKIGVHVEVDTGMGRAGVSPDALPALLSILDNSPCLHLEGVLTHFACADNPEADDFTRQQMDRFAHACDLAGIERRSPDVLRHAAATAGAVRFPSARLDMIRIGLGLYGLYPSEAVQNELELVPAIALVSRIVDIHVHKRGDHIGYNGTFVVPQDGFRKAVLPIGYHDGMPISASNRGHVLVHGQPAPICGRISMDSMAIDVTHVPDAQIGTDALLYGARNGWVLRPEAAAEAAQTIVYEMLARIGPRVQRIFLGR